MSCGCLPIRQHLSGTHYWQRRREPMEGGIQTKSHGSRCSVLFADVLGSRGPEEMWGRKAHQVSRAKVLGLCNKEEHGRILSWADRGRIPKVLVGKYGVLVGTWVPHMYSMYLYAMYSLSLSSVSFSSWPNETASQICQTVSRTEEQEQAEIRHSSLVSTEWRSETSEQWTESREQSAVSSELVQDEALASIGRSPCGESQIACMYLPRK